MGVRQTRRLLGILATAALMAAVAQPFAALAAPSLPDHVVYPTGQFPADVERVQAAVDQGGTVLLKATDVEGRPTAFDFGTPVRSADRVVFLETDVSVVGETVSQGQTRIRGGYIPFLGVTKSHTKIQGIHFDAPLVSAIIIIRSSGSEILDNRISRAVGAPHSFGLTEGRGIKFLGNSDPDGAITGTVRVAGNVIEDMHADLSDAIVFDAVAADTEIVRNRIDTVQSSGILVIRSKNLVTIARNTVRPGPGDPGEFSFGNGMTIVGSRGASYRIQHNDVLAENPGSDGILLAGFDGAGLIDRAVLDGNTVEMRDSDFGGITLFGGVSRSLVTNNLVKGDGLLGIDLASDGGPDLAVANTLTGNNVALFDERVADVFLDVHTRDTVLAGRGGTVVDLGTGNRITGYGPIGRDGSFGKQIRDAQRDKQETQSPALGGGESPEG